MTDQSFAGLLDQKVGEVEAPALLPAGTYRLLIKAGGRAFGTSSQKKTPYCEFSFTVTEPGSDLTSQPELLEGVKWNNKTLTYTFYLTEDALKMLETFLKAAGATEGQSLRESIEQVTDGGHEVLGTIAHEMFERKDGTQGVSAKLTPNFASV